MLVPYNRVINHAEHQLPRMVVYHDGQLPDWQSTMSGSLPQRQFFWVRYTGGMGGSSIGILVGNRPMFKMVFKKRLPIKWLWITMFHT